MPDGPWRTALNKTARIAPVPARKLAPILECFVSSFIFAPRRSVDLFEVRFHPPKVCKQFACQASLPSASRAFTKEKRRMSWAESNRALTSTRKITNSSDQSWRAGGMRLPPLIDRSEERRVGKEWR